MRKKTVGAPFTGALKTGVREKTVGAPFTGALKIGVREKAVGAPFTGALKIGVREKTGRAPARSRRAPAGCLYNWILSNNMRLCLALA